MKHSKKASGLSGAGLLISAVIGLLLLISLLLIWRPLFVLKQKQAAPPGGLHLVSNYMRSCVLNKNAWAATIADTDNRSMECLRRHSDCDVEQIRPPASYIKLKASMGLNDFCYQMYNTLPGVNDDGFTKEGVACTGFSTEGNEKCPYRFNVYWTAECPEGEKRCRNPIVRVNGDFARGSQDQNKKTEMDFSRFSLRTVRGRGDQVGYFTLYETSKGGQTLPIEPCSMKGVSRVFNRIIDPGGYVTLRKDGFELRPGQYACSISVPGYRVGNFKAALVDLSKSPPQILLSGTSEYSGVVNNYTQARSEIVGGFVLTNKTTLGIIQVCSGTADHPKEKARDLGVPMGQHPQWDDTFSVAQCWVM